MALGGTTCIWPPARTDGRLHLRAFERAITAVFATLHTSASTRLCDASGLRAVSGFPIDEGRTLLEVPEHAFDLLQGAAEVFGDLSRQHVRVR